MIPYFQDENIAIYNADVMDGLAQLPDESVQCAVTSPPYWGLRDYGVEGQIGLERSPEEYVEKMVAVFDEIRRVLKKDGTLWLNMGDSYSGSGKGRKADGSHSKGGKRDTNQGSCIGNLDKSITGNIKPKDLVGIPWMLAFALRADGWYLRNDIIWAKPNPMPESVTDRCTRAHEYIFHLTKSANYFYDADAIRTAGKNPEDDIRRLNQQKWGNKSSPTEMRNGLRAKKLTKPSGWDRGENRKANDLTGRFSHKPEKKRGHAKKHTGFINNWDHMSIKEQQAKGANKRSVWTIATRPFPDAHFATFPQQLAETCILAGSRPGDTVLDPFWGSGTTGEVAVKQGRQAIGIELNPNYCELSLKRFRQKTLNFQRGSWIYFQA